jgi:hypothetical protein
MAAASLYATRAPPLGVSTKPGSVLNLQTVLCTLTAPVRDGGVAAWMHPSYDDGNSEKLAGLARPGRSAVEVQHLDVRPARSYDQAGGSDCHGPDLPARSIGAYRVSTAALDTLRQMAMR